MIGDQRDYGDEMDGHDRRPSLPEGFGDNSIPPQKIDKKGKIGFPFVLTASDKRFLRSLRISSETK